MKALVLSRLMILRQDWLESTLLLCKVCNPAMDLPLHPASDM